VSVEWRAGVQLSICTDISSITSSNQSLEVKETALDLPNHGKLSIPGRVLCRCEALFSPIGRYDTSVSGWTITDYLATSFDILSTVGDKFVLSLLVWVSLTNCTRRAGCSIRTVWFSDLPTGTCSILNSLGPVIAPRTWYYVGNLNISFIERHVFSVLWANFFQDLCCSF
jgi:hypothetical protein